MVPLKDAKDFATVAEHQFLLLMLRSRKSFYKQDGKETLFDNDGNFLFNKLSEFTLKGN